MKKLLLVIFTLSIFSIGFNKIYAVNSNVIIANTLRVGYTTQQGSSTITQVSFNGYRSTVALNDYSNLDSIEIFFSGQNAPLSEHLVFSGYVDYSVLADVSQGANNYLPDTMSVIGLSDSNDHRIGACTLNNLSVTRFNSTLDYSTSGTSPLTKNGVTMAFTVDCRVDVALANGTNMNRLQFYIPTPIGGNEIHTTTITMQINPGVIGYDGEYTDDIRAVVNAINNITINGATVNIDQTPVTNAIDNSTQQIVDQLTNESCSSCDNIYNMPTESRVYNGVTFSSSDQKLSLNGIFSSSGVFPFFNSSVSIPAGTYTFIINKPLNRVIYPMWNQDNCSIPAGSTSVSCTISQSRNVGWRYSFEQNEVVNYTDLQFYVGTGSTFCVYGQQLCTGSNKLDDINSSIDQTNDYLQEDYSQSTTDDFQDNLMDTAVDVDDYVPINSVFTAFQNLITSISTGVCEPYNLPLPASVFGSNSSLSIPCIGTYLWNKFPEIIAIWRTFSNYLIFTIFIINIYTDINDILHGRDLSIIANQSYRNKTDDN